MKKKLTVRGINALKAADAGKRDMFWDTEVANFGIRVTDAGKISFIVMRRVDGKLMRRVVAEHRVGAEYTEGLLTRAREDARAACAHHQDAEIIYFRKAAEFFRAARRGTIRKRTRWTWELSGDRVCRLFSLSLAFSTASHVRHLEKVSSGACGRWKWFDGKTCPICPSRLRSADRRVGSRPRATQRRSGFWVPARCLGHSATRCFTRVPSSAI